MKTRALVAQLEKLDYTKSLAEFMQALPLHLLEDLYAAVKASELDVVLYFTTRLLTGTGGNDAIDITMDRLAVLQERAEFAITAERLSRRGFVTVTWPAGLDDDTGKMDLLPTPKGIHRFELLKKGVRLA